jgi:hypothetical protein
MRARRDRSQPVNLGDDGQALIVVLLFALVFSLILGALITNASTNLGNTVTVRGQEANVYAADSGIDWGLQTIRNDNTLCTGSPTTQTLTGVPTFNGQTPTVTCEVVSGNATGANGWAIITTDTSSPGSFSTAGPSPFPRTVNGPIFSAGIADDIENVHVNGGHVYEQNIGSNCSSPADQPSGILIAPTPPYGYHCTTDPNPGPSVPHALPNSVPSIAPNPVTTGGCTVFSPGKYTSTNYLPGKNNYFVSGVYYFVDVNIDVRKMQIVGGAKSSPSEQSLLTPCASDPAGTVGTGVRWILGGSSAINVRDPSGLIELFERVNGPASEGTQGISIQTVQGSDPGGWPASSLGVNDLVLQEGNGNTPLAAIHGLVYTPNAKVDLDATNTARAWLLAGVVTGRLVLRQQATVDGVRVSVETGLGEREIILTSTSGPSTGAHAVATAVLTITNDAPRTLDIQSWRTSCQQPNSSPCVSD